MGEQGAYVRLVV